MSADTRAFSGGNVPLGGGTSVQKKYGIEDSPDLVFKDLTDWSVVQPNGAPDYRYNDHEIIRAFADNSAATFEWLVAHGVVFALKDHAGLLCRPCQDAGRLCLGVVRPDDRRPDGLLRRPVPGRWRLLGDAGQGQPVQAGHRGLSRPRRLLPRLDRWSRGPLGPGLHQVGVECSSTKSWAWRRCGRSTWRDFPAFIVVDDKGNDFFTDPSGTVTVPITGIRVRSAERA